MPEAAVTRWGRRGGPSSGKRSVLIGKCIALSGNQSANVSWRLRLGREAEMRTLILAERAARRAARIQQDPRR